MRFRRLITVGAVAGLLSAGAALVLAGSLKVQDVAEFERTVRALGLFSDHAASMVASAVPMLETVIGTLIILLIAFRWFKPAGFLAGAVFTMFAWYAFLLALNPPLQPVSCGCLARNHVVDSWWPLAARNGTISVALLACGWWASRARSTTLISAEPFTPQGVQAAADPT
jgi:hypothetical protein